jgi:hypothetical protein
MRVRLGIRGLGQNRRGWFECRREMFYKTFVVVVESKV